MNDTILQVDDIQKIYGNKGTLTKAVDHISFSVSKGEFLGIMGSSGSGKSTLLNCIATVIQPDGGRIRMKGREIQSLKGKKLAQYRGISWHHGGLWFRENHFTELYFYD